MYQLFSPCGQRKLQRMISVHTGAPTQGLASIKWAWQERPKKIRREKSMYQHWKIALAKECCGIDGEGREVAYKAHMVHHEVLQQPHACRTCELLRKVLNSGNNSVGKLYIALHRIEAATTGIQEMLQ